MGISISNILESVCNPQGRFRSLEGIYPLGDEHGTPRILSSSNSQVRFPVKWNGSEYVMQVFLSDDSQRMEKLRELMRIIDGADSPYLTEFNALPSEITVFDSSAEAHYCDITLTRTPPGAALAYFIKESCARNDIQALKNVLGQFCDMAVWLLGSGLSHGRVNFRNIRVNNSGRIKLVNYDHMRHAPDADTDNKDIAAIALYIKLLSQDPGRYELLGKWTVSEIAGNINDPAGLMRRSGDRRTLAAALETFAGTAETLRIDLSSLTSDTTPPELRDSSAGIDTRTWNRKHYDNIERMEESLRCVELNGKFGFIDENWSEVIPLIYDNATGFKEGRSVVVLDSLFGMIDKEGGLILPVIYESVDWYCEDGVAKIACDGRFGLVDRKARPLTGLDYEWMGEVSEGMICVRRDEMYGYISSDGKPAIEPVYSDANEFRGGTAVVRHGKVTMFINHAGEEVSPPVKITVHG